MLPDFFDWLTVVTGGNEFATAGIATSLMVSATMLLKTVPIKLYSLIKRQVVTSLTVNNTTYTDRMLFQRINELIQKNTSAGFSRTFSMNARWGGEGNLRLSLGIGYGNHLTLYRGRLLLIHKTALDSSGGDLLKEQITVTKLGRSAAVFHDLVEDLNVYERRDEVAIYDYKDEWRLKQHMPRRLLTDIALSPDTLAFFTDEVEAFINGEATFKHLGLPHKLTMVLHGEPGTGKTSIIRAIAGTYRMPVCILNLSMMSDNSLLNAMLTAPKNAIITFEDVDAATSTHDRAGVTADSDGYSFLTLSGILNALDGIQSLQGNIVVLTTNYLDRLDPALLRPGRVDHLIELPAIDSVTVQQYFEKLYPDLDTDDIIFNDMLAKDITDVVVRAKCCPIKAKHQLMLYHNRQLKRVA